MSTSPDPRQFTLDPAHYGLPTRDDLIAMRIWDIHYHGLSGGDLRRHEETMFYVERMGIERVLSLDIAGSQADPLGRSVPAEARRAIRRFLEEHADRVSGLIPIDPGKPEESCRKMEEWIRDGPCVGIKYYGGNPQGVTCSHPNNDPIIKLAGDLQAIIYIHTWMIVGGNPRRPAGENAAGESTPMDVARLAERFPGVSLICGHSGGDWELGVRAVRNRPSVFIEFSGSDPHSGQVDYTVAQLGADRLVWGGHGPTRSYSTELSKVLDADLHDTQRRQIFGGNLRRIAAPIFRRKGYRLDP
jgi:predicted TIM-barrel fold metal-dependent hydrolase